MSWLLGLYQRLWSNIVTIVIDNLVQVDLGPALRVQQGFTAATVQVAPRVEETGLVSRRTHSTTSTAIIGKQLLFTEYSKQ